jgi:hypothetical protein
VDAVLEAMQGRVLDSGKLTGWEKRQTNREDSSTERVKKWRETKVKRNATQSNATKPDVTHTKHNVTADKKREEEIKKEQKPSRAASDQRHVPFKLACEIYAKHKGVTFVWDGGEAKILASLLAASPDLTLGIFQQCLNHRAKSQVPHGERPREWLGTILKYQEGPLNEYGKPVAAMAKFEPGVRETPTEQDEEQTLFYWKSMKDKGQEIYKTAPAWVKKKLEES